jgi:aminoglycoside phosphotransferase (APT) family kinase protein
MATSGLVRGPVPGCEEPKYAMTTPARPPDTTDQAAFEAAQHAGITHWVRENLGGEVLEITRLERWRPCWKVAYAKGDRTAAVFVRGDRPIAGERALRFEMQVMEVLEAHGIRVPHIHGWMDAPKAFVMDWVDTEDRAPGMLHTAIENPTSMSDERWQAMLHYMDHLALVHAVPVEAFSHIKGLSVPETARDIALEQTERMHGYGTKTGNVDAPLEFLQSWLRCNVPEHRTEVRFITGDAGQFMSAGTDVVALLDFEIAAIGDTHWDLACFRGRHPYENMGDIPALYRRYAEASGTEVDLRVVGYYTVNFLQLSSIAARTFMNPDIRGANWIEGILEYGSITRRALEAIAELQGIQLDYDLHLPEPDIRPFEDSGLRKLLVDIERLPTSSAFELWERDLLGAIPNFLLNHARYRDWFEAETVADMGRMAGRKFDDLASAETAAMEIIAAGDPARDEELVRIMHRRILRFSMIAAGTDPDEKNPFFHRLDPILG